MAEDIFDVIIVGAGLAGCTAGLMLARQGKEVLVIERGNYAGSKNMTGGRLYAHSLERVIPGFAAKAPIERVITRERVSFLTNERGAMVEYQAERPEQPEQASYTVLRSRFDQWLMSEAEEAGVQFIPGVRVEELLMEDGRVTGVQAGDDKLEARVVILADGVNSILGEQCGLLQNRVASKNTAVGVKELIELPREVIEDRFGLQDNEGAAWLFAGSPSGGLMGGGFIYTNETSLSVGVVCGLHHIEQACKSVPQMLEDFKAHPQVAPLLKGGKLLEYSAHVVPEGGLGMVPRLVGNGVLIAGDAAGLCLNLGYTIRGMDLAIASGEAAARAIMSVPAEAAFSEANLSLYKGLLQESILKDMQLYKNLPAFMENPRIFNVYPKMVTDLMHDVFTVDGKAASPLWKKALQHTRSVGFGALLMDGVKGVRAL